MNTEDKKYDYQTIESKWQKKWEESSIYKTDLINAKNPFYNLMMFPYPSAAGLHIGNVYGYIGSDVYSRYKRFMGYDVFEPIGFDSFGIHGENYALKLNRHPKDVMEENISHFRDVQLKRIGNMFDWSHEVRTSDPSYYKWTQWIFLQLFKAGLAERKEAPVNWCPSCKTVLADEQVISGKCERCGTEVIIKDLTQWFFKITKYADRLYNNLSVIDWSKKTIDAQRNWIGKSEGYFVKFIISGQKEPLEVFTTHLETLLGVSFIAISSQNNLTKSIKYKDIIDKIQNVSMVKNDDNSKEGVFTGMFCVHPITKKKIPIWVANYVLEQYGTGAVMGVPAHDERDAEFAAKYALTSTKVVDDGILVNSGNLDGLSVKTAIEELENMLKKTGSIRKDVVFRLRDWTISRQRYWGAPIPIIYCEKCGIVPVPESELPVELPESVDITPSSTGLPPLARVESFANVKCPNCNSNAKRDTDVFDNFLDSAWYFLRYPSTEYNNVAFDKSITKKWLPVDQYIGGNEHAVLHLMYSRFIIMVLHDLGYLEFEEPYKRFRANGWIVRDGIKMSKSLGNIINPDEYIEKYGADVIRMYLMFMAPLEEGGDFQDSAIKGIVRFIDKVYRFYNSDIKIGSGIGSEIDIKINEFNKSISNDIENLKFNTAISTLMIYFKWIEAVNGKWTEEEKKRILDTFLIMLSTLAPHLCEELWVNAQNNQFSIFNSKWPEIKDVQIEKFKLVIQVNSKFRGVIEAMIGSSKDDIINLIYQTNPGISKYIEKDKIKKSIYVQDKVINLID